MESMLCPCILCRSLPKNGATRLGWTYLLFRLLLLLFLGGRQTQPPKSVRPEAMDTVFLAGAPLSRAFVNMGDIAIAASNVEASSIDIAGSNSFTTKKKVKLPIIKTWVVNHAPLKGTY